MTVTSPSTSKECCKMHMYGINPGFLFERAWKTITIASATSIFLWTWRHGHSRVETKYSFITLHSSSRNLHQHTLRTNPKHSNDRILTLCPFSSGGVTVVLGVLFVGPKQQKNELSKFLLLGFFEFVGGGAVKKCRRNIYPLYIWYLNNCFFRFPQYFTLV